MSYPFNFAFLYGAENDGTVPPLAVPSTFSKTAAESVEFNQQWLNTAANFVENNISNLGLVQNLSNNYPTSTLNDIVAYYKNDPNKKVDLIDIVARENI